MNPTTIISLVLWIPFVITVIIAGLIFCINGYKKGTIRSLFSLGATIVAAVLSLLVSKLCARPLAKSFGAMITTNMSLEDMPIGADAIMSIVESGLRIVASILLFSIFMFILTIVLKTVAKKVKSDCFQPTTKGQKWGGFGVRFADTIIFALFLFMPLYATLGNYVPTAQVVASYISEDEETTRYLSAVSAHPLVQVSSAGPVQWFYSGLSSTKVDGYSFNISQMATSMEKVVGLFQGIGEVDKEELPQMAEELIQVLRDDIVNTDWFYYFANTAVTSVKEMYLLEINNMEPEAAAQLQEVLDLMDMSEEDMKTNFNAILDFGEYLLKNDFIAIMDSDTEQFDALYEMDFFGKLGELANCSPQAVALKNIIYMSAAKELQESDPEVAALVMSMTSATAAGAADYVAEGEALMLLMAGGDAYSIMEAVARHPQANGADAKKILEETAMSELLGLEPGTTAALYVDSNPHVKEAVLAQFDACTQGQVTDITFAQYMDTLRVVASGEYYYGLFDNGPKTVIFAANALGAEFWNGISTTEYTLMIQLPLYLSSNIRNDWNINEAFLSLSQLTDLANRGLFESGAAGSGSEFENTVVTYITSYTYSEGLYAAINAMVAEKGADPLGFGKNLNAAQKQWFKDLTAMVADGSIGGNGFGGLGNGMGSIIIGGGSTDSGDGEGDFIMGGFVSGEDGSSTITITTDENGNTVLVDQDGNIIGTMDGNGSIDMGGTSFIPGGASGLGGVATEEKLDALLAFFGIE